MVRRARSLWAEPLSSILFIFFPAEEKNSRAETAVPSAKRAARADGLVSGSLGAPAAPAPGLVQRALPGQQACRFRRRESSADAGSGMSDADAPARLAAAKEENERLRASLTDKDREIFLLKVRARPLRRPPAHPHLRRHACGQPP